MTKVDKRFKITEEQKLLWQKDYDDGLSIIKLVQKYKTSNDTVLKYIKTRTRSEANKIGSTGRKLTEECKKKISKSRIKYLKENPEKVPYLLNHHTKGESYPEKYFRELLINENINFKQEKREGLYSLDFVIDNIDLEIDGEQHYVDKRIVESDIRRTKFLEEKGYIVKRVRWSIYQTLNKREKYLFINELLGR